MFNNALRSVNVAQSILRLPAVKARTGLSRSTIYLRMSVGEFPRAIMTLNAQGFWIERRRGERHQKRRPREQEARSTLTLPHVAGP